MAEIDTRFGGNLELANRSAGLDYLAKAGSDWDRSDEEFRSFHTRTDPTREERIRGFSSPKRAGQFNWQVPSSDYYQDMRESNQMLMDYRKNKMRNMILGPDRIYPPELKYNAGITNQNLGGYEVMNALSIDPSADDFFLRELFNYGKRYFHGYDAENDEWRQQKYRDSLKKANPLEGALQGGMTGESYPDKILRDLYPQTFGGQSPYTTDKELNDILENLSPEDLGMTERLEVNLSQTWQTILDRTGSEELANQWLESQQANRGGLMSLV